jgi:hypothetical protein
MVIPKGRLEYFQLEEAASEDSYSEELFQPIGGFEGRREAALKIEVQKAQLMVDQMASY